MEIPDPPSQRACAQCVEAIWWLWSPRRRDWVGFVASTGQGDIRPHRCQPRQRPPHEQAAANAEGRRAVEQALKTKTSTDEEQR